MSLKGDKWARSPTRKRILFLVCLVSVSSFANARGEVIINWSAGLKFSETEISSPPR